MRVESRDVEIVREGVGHRLRLGAFAAIAALLGVMVFSVSLPPIVSAAVGAFAFVGIIGVVGLAIAAPLFGATEEGAPASIVVDDERLVLDRGSEREVVKVPLEEIVEGWLSPTTGHVELRRRNDDLIRIAMSEGGGELLEACGVDAGRRRMRMKLGQAMSPFALFLPIAFVLWVAVAAGGGVSLAARLGVITGCVLLPAAAVAYAIGGRHELVVGADGVRVRRLFFARFVPFAELAGVEVVRDELRLVRRDGSAVAVRIRSLFPESRAILETRIADARALAATEVRQHALASLDRGSRSVGEWRRQVARLLAPKEAYRGAAVSAEDLLRVLDSPEADVEHRIGAAIALVGAREPALKRRVRVSAEATASEAVRGVLLRVADERLEEAALEEALSAVRKGGR